MEKVKKEKEGKKKKSKLKKSLWKNKWYRINVLEYKLRYSDLL